MTRNQVVRLGKPKTLLAGPTEGFSGVLHRQGLGDRLLPMPTAMLGVRAWELSSLVAFTSRITGLPGPKTLSSKSQILALHRGARPRQTGHGNLQPMRISRYLRLPLIPVPPWLHR